MENITTEEVTDKLDMFQEIFVKLDEFGWWDMEIIQSDTSTQFTPRILSKVFLYTDYNLHQRQKTISKLITKLKWHGEHRKLFHIQLWCMYGFWMNIYIFN